ncbi:MAG: hypothetical protein J6K82_02050 [Alphaproteobacteria bacterium]|nr:hypothetical protein [Alphaproteobacteria bacterium]
MKIAFVCFLCFCWVGGAISNDVVCVDGYYLNDTGTECITVCEPGYYVKNVGEVCQELPTGYSAYYYTDTAHVVTYGETSDKYLKQCPRTADGRQGHVSSYGATTIENCLLMMSNLRYLVLGQSCPDDGSVCQYFKKTSMNHAPTHGMIQAPCYYLSGDDGDAIYAEMPGYADGGRCVGGSILTSCDSGFYAEIEMSSSVGPSRLPCVPVGVGYYSPHGDIKRYECPSGTATCGYGECADDVSDCVQYKTLKMSNNLSLIASSVKYTTPALTLKSGDSLYFVQAYSGWVANTLHVLQDGVLYSLINPLDKFTQRTYVHNLMIVPD